MDETQVVTGAADAETAEPQAGEDKFDAEYVRKLRAEAAENRRRLRELEGKIKTKEESELSESQKVAKRLAELEKANLASSQTLKEKVTKYEVMLAAQKVGIVDPDAAYRLLDLSSLEFDDSGTPVNVEKALKALITSKPYLAGGGQTSATNPAGKNVTTDPMLVAMRKSAGLKG